MDFTLFLECKTKVLINNGKSLGRDNKICYILKGGNLYDYKKISILSIK